MDESGGKPFRSGVHRLMRDAHGDLVFKDELDQHHVGVLPVQAFPIDSPGEHVSLVSTEGHELAFILSLADIEAETRHVILDEIAQREFIPVIQRLVAVSTFATPSTWSVHTDRGVSNFVLKGEEDIRRLRGNGLLITDSHGVTYRVLDMRELDRMSRRLLDRFL
ncbi:MAG: DUF1854 domain-containing protein [bacterium]|jgi:hypothetical protein